MTQSPKLQDLIDLSRLQSLLESLYHSSGIPSSVVDLEGAVLAHAGWQDICTQFHRLHPDSLRDCNQSDVDLAQGLSGAKGPVQLICPQGLTSAAIPLVIGGWHLANVFAGQLLLGEPDRERFRRQAARFGFSEEAYLGALDRVSIVTQERLDGNLAFIAQFTEFLAEQGLTKLGALEAQEQLQRSETRAQTIFETTMEGLWIVDLEGRLLAVNPAYVAMSGYEEAELLDMSIPQLETGDSPEGIQAHVQEIRAGRRGRFETLHRRKDGSLLPVEISAQVIPGSDQIFAFIRDIRARKAREEERELIAHLILRVSTPGGLRECLMDLTGHLQKVSGCEAVGIRLREGDDFPYLETQGFPASFVELERHLCVQGPDGQILREAGGSPLLECMCGNVLRGRVDPAQPFFTAKGSFWSNSTTTLLASTSEAERQARTRNRCNGEGYESVALVSLRSGAEVFGLLQFNDPHPGRFTPEGIARLERVADSLAVALAGRQAQEAQRRSEGLYRSLFENLLNGFAYCQMLFEDGKPSDFIYLAVNGAFEEQTGLRDVVGRRVSEVIPGIRELDPVLLERYGRVATTGQAERFEVFLEALQQWFSISVYGPAPGHFVAVFDVITERKRNEAALEEHRALLQAVINGTTDAIYVKDPLGRYLMFNTAAEHFVGKRAEEVLGKDDFALFPAEEAAVVMAGDREVMAAASIRTYEESVTDPQGRTLTFLSTKGPLLVEGKCLGLFGVARDITDRKRAESALRESHARYQSLVARMPAVLYQFSRKHGGIYYSPRIEALLGYTQERLMAEPMLWHDAIHPEDCRVVNEALLGAEPGSGNTLEYRIRDAEGREHWFSDQFTCKAGPGGDLLFEGLVQDITERKRAEEEHRSLMDQLHHLQRMESIGRLAGGIAHDMNNVLAAIMAMSSLIQVQGGESAHQAQLILDASLRGRNLIQGLMAFARKEVQDAELLDLHELIRQEAELLSSITLQRIRVSLELMAETPRLLGSRSALSTALMNLCMNAVDAMPEGGGLVLRTTRIDDRTLELAVEDTGQGMSPEVVARAMEPFYTTKAVGKGTGLGLSMVFGTVQAHGGSMLIESEVGRGTQVKLRLPLSSQEGQAPRPTVEVPGGQPRKILLVDDDPLVRASAAALLESLGHRVTEAEGGLEALELLDRERGWELVLLDLNMPDMDGIQTLRVLRGLMPDLPVLVTTGYANERTRAQLEGLRPVAVLAKPYTSEEVHRAIVDILLK